MSSSSIPSAIRTRLPVEVGPAPVDGVEAADTPPVGVGVEVPPSTPPVGLGLGVGLGVAVGVAVRRKTDRLKHHFAGAGNWLSHLQIPTGFHPKAQQRCWRPAPTLGRWLVIFSTPTGLWRGRRSPWDWPQPRWG